MRGPRAPGSVQATAEPIPSTLLIRTSATASVRKQTTTWKPGGSAGHLVTCRHQLDPQGSLDGGEPQQRHCLDLPSRVTGSTRSRAGATGHSHGYGKLARRGLFRRGASATRPVLLSALEAWSLSWRGRMLGGTCPACLQNPHILPMSWALTLAFPFLLPFSSPRLSAGLLLHEKCSQEDLGDGNNPQSLEGRSC